MQKVYKDCPSFSTTVASDGSGSLGVITVYKVTEDNLVKHAMERTVRGQVKASMEKCYASKHSPIRLAQFVIDMDGVPLYASTHFVRHKIGVEHFVRSQRKDRGGTVDDGRMSHQDHCMYVNAEALMNMSYKRLCNGASKETNLIMLAIYKAVRELDPALALQMVPSCVYMNGRCPEVFSCCGLQDCMMTNYAGFLDQFNFSRLSREG